MVCPFCFRRIDASRLAFQCAGRGDAECKKATDEARKRLTRSTRTTYPTFMPLGGRDDQSASCPYCQGTTSRRACPDCHTALPIEFPDFTGAMIGVLGGENSGKTVLMIALARRLRDTGGNRYGADLELATDDPDWRRGLSDYQTYREAPLLRDGQLPPRTGAPRPGAAEHVPPVLLLWRQEEARTTSRAPARSVLLSLPESVVSKGQYLSVCGGLIVIVDPLALPGARAALGLPPAEPGHDEYVPRHALADITETLRVEHNVSDSKKITIPVAVVFTKIDAFFPTLDRGSPLAGTAPAVPAYSEADGRAVHEQMRALLHDWNAQDIDRHVQLNYADFRYFGVSALGAEPDHANSAVAAGGVRPHRVEDPVLWLLSRTGTVPSQ